MASMPSPAGTRGTWNTMRPTIACALILSLAAMPAFAGDAMQPGELDALDLSLPDQAYRNDPPGTWYGDTSGVPASESTTVARRSACPTAPDGSERDVTGSVSAGIGHSSHFGNSNWQAASLNYCKESADDDGNPRSFNLRLDVGTFDGAMPGAWMGPPPGPHPWGRGPR